MPKPITIPDTLMAWCQLAPRGSFTRRRADGTEYTQLLDDTSIKRLIEVFNAAGRDVLLDYEHRSQTTDDSRAAGWIKQLRDKDGFLEALILFTAGGAEAVRSRDLRYLSPVWALDADGRPEALASAGLTNTPYFKELRPVLNKSGGEHNTTLNKGQADMLKELAILFGLAEDAPEADIIAAVKKFKEDSDAAAIAAEAGQVAAANSAKIADTAAFIKAYCANKDAALAVLAACKEPQKPAVINKADARTPSFKASAPVAMNREEFKKNLAGLPPAQRQAYYDANIGQVTD